MSHDHTPVGRFTMLDTSTVGLASVLKRTALEASRPEPSYDASFGISTLLVVEQSSFEKHPRRV